MIQMIPQTDTERKTCQAKAESERINTQTPLTASHTPVVPINFEEERCKKNEHTRTSSLLGELKRGMMLAIESTAPLDERGLRAFLLSPRFLLSKAKK
jgi:hypothetical protein